MTDKEPKKEVTETINWIDNETAEYELAEEIHFENDDGTTRATRTRKDHAVVTAEDLLKGQETLEYTISKLNERKEVAQENLKKLGKPVKMTREMRQLKKLINDIGRYDEQIKINSELEKIENDLKENRNHLAQRIAGLNKRPEA